MALTRDDCRRYLESLQMGEELVERGLAASAAMQRFLPAGPEHIFVSECRDEEDRRSAGSLWLLGPGFVAEGFRFTCAAEFDITRVDKGVLRLVVDRDEYGDAGGRPRLTVTVNHDCQILGLFEATGRNCRALEDILERYLVPLLAVR